MPSEEEDQLYEMLLWNYRPEVRPVKKDKDAVQVQFGAALIRLIDLDEKEQLLTINLWLEMVCVIARTERGFCPSSADPQNTPYFYARLAAVNTPWRRLYPKQWNDPHLAWNPEKHGNITKIHISADQLWVPDIVLYDNAAGDPHVTIFNDAMVYFDGTVNWKPPSIYKSNCPINIQYFPFDEQSCRMKFGHWSNNAMSMDIVQLLDKTANQKLKTIVEEDEQGNMNDVQFNMHGMDLSYYQLHNSWDLINVTSKRHKIIYLGCCGLDSFIDISFYLDFRRKPLFFFVNLVVPCVLLALMTPFVFYVPAQGHKITFAISILLSLMVFLQVLVELVPPVSLHIPLIGIYLLFTMLLIVMSIFLSTLSLSVYHGGAYGKVVPHWVRYHVLLTLPKYLGMQPYTPPKSGYVPKELKRSSFKDGQGLSYKVSDTSKFVYYRQSSPVLCQGQMPENIIYINPPTPPNGESGGSKEERKIVVYNHPMIIRRMLRHVRFIAQYYSDKQEEKDICMEWHYVSMIIDRICLIVFTVANILGTVIIFGSAPALWQRVRHIPLDPATKPLGGDTYNISGVTVSDDVLAEWN